jgi:hypothetical protein
VTGQIIAVDAGRRSGHDGSASWLGNIGKPMALRLTDLDLRVYDVVPEPVAGRSVAGGATAAARWPRSRTWTCCA